MLRQVIAGVFVLYLVWSADADPVLLKHYKMPNGEISRGLKIYIQGVKDGLETYNEQLIVEGKAPLFCLPSTAITVDQAESIMKTKAEELGKVANMDSMQISILLLEGLRTTFPCSKQ
jgi:hypothetical protein